MLYEIMVKSIEDSHQLIMSMTRLEFHAIRNISYFWSFKTPRSKCHKRDTCQNSLDAGKGVEHAL